MKCGCHDLAGEAASARSHCDRGEALHPPRVSALQSPLLRPRHGAPGVWTPSCIISAHSRSSSAHALSPLEILSRKLRRMRNTCVRHFPELEQLAAWHCSTVMNMATDTSTRPCGSPCPATSKAWAAEVPNHASQPRLPRPRCASRRCRRPGPRSCSLRPGRAAHTPRAATGPAAQPRTGRTQPRRAAPRSPPRTLSRATSADRLELVIFMPVTLDPSIFFSGGRDTVPPISVGASTMRMHAPAQHAPAHAPSTSLWARKPRSLLQRSFGKTAKVYIPRKDVCESHGQVQNPSTRSLWSIH